MDKLCILICCVSIILLSLVALLDLLEMPKQLKRIADALERKDGVEMANFPSVCRDCKPPKRKLNCHATCKEYLDAKVGYAERVDQERKAKKNAEDANSVLFRMKRN